MNAVPPKDELQAIQSADAPVAGPGNSELVPDPSQQVITRVDDVLKGQVVSQKDGAFELPEARREDAVIIAISQNFTVGLFSEEVFGKAGMFDVLAQFRRKDLVISPRRATREVIRLVYEGSNEAVTVEAPDATNIERLNRSLIDDAVLAGASDIHIETRDSRRADVYFRINGERVHKSNLAFETAKSMGSVLYSVHADVQSKKVAWDIYRVSEGSIEWPTTRGEVLQLRFSSSPIFPTGNFHIVLRLMSTRAQPRDLSKLGYSRSQLPAMDSFTNGSGGMVLMVGPTNSGKSTSMQSMIGRLYAVRGPETKVITVEDPVELVIPGACQISVPQNNQGDGRHESAFTSFLRGTLRQDPDVVLVGEIRDRDSASIACDLALAGRKVFATLHANSALWAFPRLRKMGVDSDLLTMPGFIAGICCQKLVPVLCPQCSQVHNFNPNDSLLHKIVHDNLGGRQAKRRGTGCAKCGGTGIIGRTLVAEVITPNRELLAALARDDMAAAESIWMSGRGNPSLEDGLVTLNDHLVQKILIGQVSIADGIKNIGIADQYHFGAKSQEKALA
ncbi:general secretion pathway protein E [Roseateles asaccharophilus]|uniref:GspE/PulE family protein n=1 Tax=Roseateles asaccharophilus TaxID=582607 RepID=UPI003834010E